MGFGGTLFATDLANNLYTVDPLTGAAKLLGPTGIPPLPFQLLSTNPDGSTNVFDETLFGAGGKLYATFDAVTIDFTTFTIKPVVPNSLYQIDPKTGRATLVAPTDLTLSAAVDVNGTVYAFNAAKSQVVTLDLSNGKTSFVSNYDRALGPIGGAAAVPEPASIALAGIGIAAIVVCRRRKSLCKHATGYLLMLSFALCATTNAFGQGPTFTTIDYPGATATQPWGMNTRGDIVGYYVSGGVTHGFLLSGGQFTSIEFPDAIGTEVYAINPRGDVGGVYTLAGARHGFLLSGGQFTKVDYPGATTTEVAAINARGEMVGVYVLGGVNHGFLLSGGQFSTVDFPDATSTILNGINAQGDITAAYSSAGVRHAFMLSDGDFTSFDFAGSTFTGAYGINQRGDVAGRFTASGVTHGYLLSGGQFSTFDVPGATFTGATAINQRGDIAGRYTADGVTHGFLMTGFRPACVVAMSAPRIAAVTHSSDFTQITASKPGAAGEVLSIFASGLGPTRPSVGTGQPFPSSTLAPVDSLVEVRVNGRSAIVYGAVGFPGAVDGYQVNFRVAADSAKGMAVIELSAGGVAGPPVRVMIQ